MEDKIRQSRLERIRPFLAALRRNEEPQASSKQQLLLLMQDLKDEGNTLFRESKFGDARHYYCFALFIARQLERTMYHPVEKEFLATLFCNASLCCLKIDNFEEALKDADLALCCQKDNIKAIYRRCLALKGLGRYREAIEQAKEGKKVDPKNHFDELINSIKELGEKPSKSKSGNSKTSSASEVSSEWLEGTNALITEKKRESVIKNMPPKKKKGQSRAQSQSQKSAAEKNQSASSEAQNRSFPSDRDSDSTISDDEQFAAKMKNIQKQPAVNKAPITHNSVNVGASARGATANILKSNGRSTMGLDDFSFESRKVTQEKKTAPSNLHWPLEGYDFRLVCRLCFVKEGEGVGGYSYRDKIPHACGHDILIVRTKNSPHLNWLKIRPRNTVDSKPHLFKYKMCLQFQQHLPCRIGESNCTFAHNHAEVTLWNLDRDRVFSITGFMSEAKRQGVLASQDLSKSQANAAAQNIPGIQSVLGGRRQQSQTRSPAATPSPPPQSFPQAWTQRQQSQTRSPAPTPSPPPQTHQASSNRTYSSMSSYSQSATFGGTAGMSPFAEPPSQPKNPVFPSQQQQQHQPFSNFQYSNAASHTTYQSMYSQPPPTSPPMTKPPPSFQPQAGGPFSSTPTFPNVSRPPPTQGNIPNPLQEYKYRLCCPLCLTYSGRPWYYKYDSKVHQCAQSILTYFVQDEFSNDLCVQIRERASHRTFKGGYVLCHSVLLCNPDCCKFKENCSFAHNKLEQILWKLEQQGLFDIGEFILQNKKAESTNTTGSSSSGMYVRHLLHKFGGYFRFICRECFFSPQPMISSKGQGNTCTGAVQHDWSRSRILAHVKDTSFTPIDERKFVHASAFYLMCNRMQYCSYWLENRCRFAHSLVEREVWMLERDTKISREELVTQSIHLYNNVHANGKPDPQPATNAWGTRAPPPPRTTTPGTEQQRSTGGLSFHLTEFCRTCWGNGQRSAEDGKKDKCVKGHSNFKMNSVFVSLPSGKEVRSLPLNLPQTTKLILCEYHPKCTRRCCTHPHGQEELEVWSWMLRCQIKTLREMCDKCQEVQKNKTRNIHEGESVISVGFQHGSSMAQTKPVNQIIVPGDLVISEHYCHYCGISCNSERQWDNHRMSERHINNVNSDKEHQWNFRQPPWGQGNNLTLCAKHLHNQSCQYSHVPDKYNLCKYAHSQEELDEWQERFEWRQMKRMVARERHMFSYTESLLEEYHSKDDSVNVISDTLPGVDVSCNEELVLYKDEKNATFMWTFEIHTQQPLEKVALVHNRHRLHFSLVGSDETRHQIASGDIFLDIDSLGNACYKVNVNFSGGMYGSFSQWVVFDFGTHPVLVRKLAVEIGDFLHHDQVKELRQDLTFDHWTSENKEIIRVQDETVDPFTAQLLWKYKEPATAEDVVTIDSLTELNQHNYVHKMHKLLQLEEITRKRIISNCNLLAVVTASERLEEPGIFLTTGNTGDLFVKVSLTESLITDTVAGELILSNVRKVLIAQANTVSRKVYEADIVGEDNYGYNGKGKEYIYLIVCANTAKALGMSQGKAVHIEMQFQMDRKFFCRMHHALDSLQSTDVVFPDVVKFKPNFSQLSSAMKFKSQVLNDDQMTAVRHIVVERDGYTPPFIMYGPFGTGKTETLAQAVMILLRERKSVRILICTQSNSAADLYITKHLDAVFKKPGTHLRMLRLNAQTRRRTTVESKVLPYCYPPQGKSFEIPSKSHVQEHHVVLTTVENAVELTTMGLHNQFTHIFIDEAGQTLECDILMPLTLASTKTCVVLTGDHHQIGPRVYSQEAKRQKFDVSILVRLYNYYDQIAKSGITQLAETSQKSPLNIFLSINYRTKLEILRFISSVFYGGPDNLKAYGRIPSVMGITPLMFYAVQGPETQHADSTSYLNHPEAQEIVERVTQLLDKWPEEWGPRDSSKIGVVSTYPDQIRHIRKMLREKRQPLLSKIDVGPIQSFQGKEVRAMFISTVRTISLLEQPHIIRSLEAGQGIGDLGFMSNPKLLNTALTRTQSFVAVVGDPGALCLIGECIQVWRTYLKHCTNMKSVEPPEVTYDFVKHQVINIQLSPLGRIVSMIEKQCRDDFKQSLGSQTAKSAHVAKNIQQHFMGAVGDAGNRFTSQQNEAMQSEIFSDSPAFRNTIIDPSQPLPTVKSSIDPVRPEAFKQSRRFTGDKLSLSSTISCEDIIFQLAKENQTIGSDGSNDLIRSEGIVIKEANGFAELEYDLDGSRQRGPFQVTTEDEDFQTFVVHDPDSNGTRVYENWSIETLISKLENEPERFVKCTFHADKDSAWATVIGPLPPQWQAFGDVGCDFYIRGQLNQGHALNGDVVVVELIGQAENGKLEVQVKGILQRGQDPTNRLYVCTANPENAGILTPINPDMPRIYSLTTSARIRLARKGHICVYKFVSSSCVEFSHYEPIFPMTSASHLFIVRYLTWEAEFTLPLGVVVGMIKRDYSLDVGMEVLEIEHNVHRALRPQAVEEAELLFPSDFTTPAEMLSGRQDLTDSYCFTVNDPSTEDLEMAISVIQSGANYEVSIHVSDVVAYVDKHSALDQECEHRGASLFPLGKPPVHMLPPQISQDICSLKAGFDRLALTVTIQVNEDGKVVGLPSISRTVIKSKRQLTHAEVEEMLLNPEDAESDYLKSCVVVLYQLSYIWRSDRLGNAHFSFDLDEGKRSTMHSHLMIKEFQILFNAVVADMLLSKFRETTPLLVQPAPQSAKLEEWRRNNATAAFNSISMAAAFLENQVCQCSSACTCVFSYMRQHQLRSGDFVSVLRDAWQTICEAVGEEDVDYELAEEMISSPENKPQQAVSAHRLSTIQQPEKYICSQHTSPSDSRHHGLCRQAYTLFTSPLRRFISMVVQRLLVACIEGTSSPYGADEIAELCAQATVKERDVEKFDKDMFLLHFAKALQVHPFVVNAVVKDVDESKMTVIIPSIKQLNRDSHTVRLHLLSPANVSSLEQQPGYVKVLWEARVYEHKGTREPQAQSSSELKLETDQLVCNIPTLFWQRLLNAVRQKDETTISACVEEISGQIGVELLPNSGVKVLSDLGKDGLMRHYVPFSFILHESQTLSIQMSAHLSGGLLTPNIQLLTLSPGLDLCVEHESESSKCFSSSALPKKAKAHQNETTYATEWLLPVLALESVEQAVKGGERVTIHHVEITWQVNIDAAGAECYRGEFILTDEFCTRCSFQPDLGNLVAATLLDGRPMLTNDPSFCLDYLCVRYKCLIGQHESDLDESVAALIDNDEPVSWVGHCVATEVSKIPGGYRVKILLKGASMKMPSELHSGSSSGPAPCTVEWICKSKEQRIADVSVRGLHHATPFVKEIVCKKKPTNTIDPLPQDNSVLKNKLSEPQESVIAECYRQPFTVVIGGPGTGKSLLAARLAHLLIGRNRTADRFKQLRNEGYTTQLMICGPTEASLDVITGLLKAMNYTDVHIVRVYSEEVEERDFPMSLSPKPSKAAKSVSTCAGMTDVALHHLIRGKANPESRSLLEQEMLLTMYGKQIVSTAQASMQKAQEFELKKAQVILCTCITSARPILRQCTNVKQVLMDDASLISEVDVLVPMVMHRSINQLVLFGDQGMPHPQSKSPLVSQLGLMRSALQLYGDTAQKLTMQYRNPPTLCSFPSSQFYQSTLNTSPQAPLRPTARTIPWPGEAGFPSVFCHVKGEESLAEGTAVPATCEDEIIHINENHAVNALVGALKQHHKVQEGNILVLAMTQAQAALIRETLPRDVSVSTVMESIGKEADYVILSTVRGLPESGLQYPPTAEWTRAHLGRVADPRVVNLAITRARAALFIFGNKDLLGCCEPWKSLFATYRGRQSLQTSTRVFIESLLSC